MLTEHSKPVEATIFKATSDLLNNDYVKVAITQFYNELQVYILSMYHEVPE